MYLLIRWAIKKNKLTLINRFLITSRTYKALDALITSDEFTSIFSKKFMESLISRVLSLPSETPETSGVSFI